MLHTMLANLLFSFVALLSVANNEASLVGTWRHDTKERTAVMKFGSDGSFHGTLATHGEVIWTSAGKWTLEGDKLHYLYTESSSEKIPIGSLDDDLVVEISSEHLLLKARNGSLYKYERVP